MKKILVLLTALLLMASPAIGVQVPEEQRSIIKVPTLSGDQFQGELFDDLDSWSFIPSQIQPPSSVTAAKSVICSSVDDPNCSQYLALNVKAFLPVCTSASTLYCIEEFFAVKNGVRVNGVFDKNYPATGLLGQFEEDSKYGVPAGKTGGLWRLPGLQHEGGSDTYWVNTQLLGWLNRDSSSVQFSPMTLGQLWSSVNAVTEVALPGARPSEASAEGGTKINSRPLLDSDRQCLMSNTDACLIAWPLDLATTYGMKIRIAQPLTGWLHGRLDTPRFFSENLGNGSFQLIMMGNPVSVPTLFAGTAWSKASQEIKQRFGEMPSGCCSTGEDSWYESAGRNQSGEEMISDLKMWLPYVQEKASATPTYWIARTITSSLISNREKCFEKGAINGVVTTNATAYSAGAPRFNEKTQSLDYQVASPHFDSNGGENVGTYNLQINSKVARCLYGFSKAPVTARVSVISADGKSQIETTSLKEENGWIYLSVSGFTYSSPTIRVVLKQISARSILCKKRKVSKKVTGLSPKCPKGFTKVN